MLFDAQHIHTFYGSGDAFLVLLKEQDEIIEIVPCLRKRRFKLTLYGRCPLIAFGV